ncbi:MAG TPA: hypothetical protein VN822_10310 [Candidatus Acidoferrales bacterium]|nr:hypothetical protein [Candidatus Acidoferrales bacterium]
MDNIKFNYLYRDAGNYKNWAEVVFSNPDRLTVEATTKALRDAFLQDGLFIAHQVRVPETFFSTEGDATSDDHCFHEFDTVEISLEIPNDPHKRSISQFIAEVKREAGSGWVTFDPHDRLAQQESD